VLLLPPVETTVVSTAVHPAHIEQPQTNNFVGNFGRRRAHKSYNKPKIKRPGWRNGWTPCCCTGRLPPSIDRQQQVSAETLLEPANAKHEKRQYL
jgi:hypothetical protein